MDTTTATVVTFTEYSQEAINRLLKHKDQFFTLTDEDNNDNYSLAILKTKTLYEKLPEAIQSETDCEEIKSIELDFIKHNYSINCKVELIMDGEEETRNFNLHQCVVY